MKLLGNMLMNLLSAAPAATPPPPHLPPLLLTLRRRRCNASVKSTVITKYRCSSKRFSSLVVWHPTHFYPRSSALASMSRLLFEWKVNRRKRSGVCV
jgi:hypothetical protein